MSKSVIANNTTIKISAAVNASDTHSSTNETATLYTCPSSSYAIVQLILEEASTTASALFKIDGSVVKSASTGGAGTATIAAASFYIGPSQVLSVTWGGAATSAVARVQGVEFVNTP